MEKNGELFPAGDGLSEIFRTMELYQRAAVIVSPQLMVLQQTISAAALLEHGSFYSIEDHLSQTVCREIRSCIHEMREGQSEETLNGERYGIRILSIHDRALLLFEDTESRMPALLLDAMRMRQSAAVLLGTAEQVKELAGGEELARRIRRQAMMLTRQALHSETLGGAAARPMGTVCDLSELAQHIAQLLRSSGISVTVDAQPNVMIAGDMALLHAAVATLVSNCVKHGGKNVSIRIAVQRSEDGVLVRIEDDGPGMSHEAILRSKSGWKQKENDLMTSGWGMGIPFAMRVAQLHGGQLYYIYGERGCKACMRLRDAEGVGLHSHMRYDHGGMDIVAVELSTVLDPMSLLTEQSERGG